MRRIFLFLVFLTCFGLVPLSRADFICDPVGWEERGPEWVRWLSTAVRVNGASGTMCHYDRTQNWMYVITAGHLFDKMQYRLGRTTVRVDVFYWGTQKLARPRTYAAVLLGTVYEHDTENHHAYDVALLRFHPDWANPQYSPIAPKDFKLEFGRYYHSVGCDQVEPMTMSEPAHYLDMYWYDDPIGSGLTQVMTYKDYPRGGRSGGGVFTDDGQLVFICSRRHGEGPKGGSWTSLNQIYHFLNETGYGFVADDIPARRKQIVDLDHPGYAKPREFILVPSR